MLQKLESFSPKYGAIGAAVFASFCISFVMQSGQNDRTVMILSDHAIQTQTQPSVLNAVEVTQNQDVIFVQNEEQPPREYVQILEWDTASVSIDVPVMDTAPADTAILRMRAPVVSSCVPKVTATPNAAAMIDLTISASCRGYETIIIEHEGLKVSKQLNSRGFASLNMPALSAKAAVNVRFEDDTAATVTADVPRLELFDRVAVQWRGQNGLDIHAFEFGANFNEAGHVWGQNRADAFRASVGWGGFMVRLGDHTLENAYMAEVYTFPTGLSTRQGIVEIALEAEVTAQNCDQRISAQSLQYTPESGVSVSEVTLNVPACDMVGEFLMLNNLVKPLHVTDY
ncbi:MAG: hypothetical protein ACWA40_07190 [Planktomarina sp.]